MSTPQAEIKMATPYEVRFSEKIRAKYGFKDGHVELEVELPFPLSTIKKTYTEKFTVKEVKQLREAVEKAVMWADLPDFQRERDGA
jgi:UDP-galactopyranose mutase